jgi:hypothetical protein
VVKKLRASDRELLLFGFEWIRYFVWGIPSNTSVPDSATTLQKDKRSDGRCNVNRTESYRWKTDRQVRLLFACHRLGDIEAIIADLFQVGQQADVDQSLIDAAFIGTKPLDMIVTIFFPHGIDGVFDGCRPDS